MITDPQTIPGLSSPRKCGQGAANRELAPGSHSSSGRPQAGRPAVGARGGRRRREIAQARGGLRGSGDRADGVEREREKDVLCTSPVGARYSMGAATFFFSLFILRRMGKNKALAHHTSTYFHTRRVSF